MAKMILWLAPVLILSFAVAVVIPLAAPYDDSQHIALVEFLTPQDGCEAPCFLGIQPGVTTFDQAALMLELHPWVEQVWIHDVEMELSLRWVWNGKQPSFLKSPGVLESTGRNRVTIISVPTSLAFGDLMMALGNPDDGQMGTLYHMVRYHDLGIIARMATDCRAFWQETSLLHFSARSQFPKVYSVSEAWHEACI